MNAVPNAESNRAQSPQPAALSRWSARLLLIAAALVLVLSIARSVRNDAARGQWLGSAYYTRTHNLFTLWSPTSGARGVVSILRDRDARAGTLMLYGDDVQWQLVLDWLPTDKADEWALSIRRDGQPIWTGRVDTRRWTLHDGRWSAGAVVEDQLELYDGATGQRIAALPLVGLIRIAYGGEQSLSPSSVLRALWPQLLFALALTAAGLYLRRRAASTQALAPPGSGL